MEVKIPFQPEWETKMLTGQKVCTSRPDKYGEVGDTFKAFGAIFRVTDVKEVLLKNVSLVLWRQEGCDNVFHYTVVWKRLHPRAGWTPNKIVWVHWFKIIPEEKGGDKPCL